MMLSKGARRKLCNPIVGLTCIIALLVLYILQDLWNRGAISKRTIERLVNRNDRCDANNFFVDYKSEVEKLDHFLKDHSDHVEGHSGLFNVQHRTYHSLFCSGVTSIAEIGFNAGHSTMLMLMSNPNIKVQSFDSGRHAYSGKAFEYLKEHFPNHNFDIEWGDSVKTVPLLHTRHPDRKFDIVIVDGGHEFDVAIADIINLRLLSHPRTLLIIDDSPCRSWYCVDAAVKELERAGLIRIEQRFPISDANGFLTARYAPGAPAVGPWDQQLAISREFAAVAAELEAYLAGRGMTAHEGHSGGIPVQRWVYSHIFAFGGANGGSIASVAEIGFNAGHSALLALLAAPGARVQSFDLGQHAYAREALTLLRGRFPSRRLDVEWGDSAVTVPQFAAREPQARFDVVIVDGGHTEPQALADIENMRALSRNDTLLIIDDTPCKASYCVDSAVAEAERKGLIRVEQRFPVGDANGFLTARYVWDPPAAA